MKSWLSGAFALFLFAPLALAENISWPQEIVAGNGAVVIVYQPQIEEFSGNDLVGRAAISVKKPEADNVPVFGAIWFEGGSRAQAQPAKNHPVDTTGTAGIHRR
jgi:hypothetical protein